MPITIPTVAVLEKSAAWLALLAKRARANRYRDASVRTRGGTQCQRCYDDDDVRDVAHNMADLQIRRLPAVHRDKHLVGFISLANIAGCRRPCRRRHPACGNPDATLNLPLPGMECYTC